MEPIKRDPPLGRIVLGTAAVILGARRGGLNGWLAVIGGAAMIAHAAVDHWAPARTVPRGVSLRRTIAIEGPRAVVADRLRELDLIGPEVDITLGDARDGETTLLTVTMTCPPARARRVFVELRRLQQLVETGEEATGARRRTLDVADDTMLSVPRRARGSSPPPFRKDETV